MASEISVIDFGAIGDGRWSTVNTTNTEAVASIPDLTSADVGKLLYIFGAGAATSGGFHQDFIGTIQSVSGTNATLSPSPAATTNAATFVGTDNTAAFNSAIASLTGTNDIISIPSGAYLLMSPYMLTNGTGRFYASISLSRGGITFQGIGNPVLVGNGAWQLHDGNATRGVLLSLLAPVTNNYPLVFDGITFDGGVTNGYTSNHGFPASATTGNGWDVTHGAVWQDWVSDSAVFSSTTFKNCTFQHWRGEIVKSVISRDGFLTMTNCVFRDGNASALNSTFSQLISGCVFSNLYLAAETYVAYMTQPSVFENCIVTNADSGITMNGAMSNSVPPLYTFRGNYIKTNPRGIFCNPARNLLITNNTFDNCVVYSGGAGVQGTGYNRDWTIVNNVFTNGTSAAFINGDAIVCSNVVFLGNSIYGANYITDGFGYNYNFLVSSNSAFNCLHGTVNGRTILGECFFDDGSNAFPPNITGDSTGITNSVSFRLGYLQKILPVVANCTFELAESLLPPGAKMKVVNGGTFDATVRASGKDNLIHPGQFRLFAWTGSVWSEFSPFTFQALYPASVKGK